MKREEQLLIDSQVDTLKNKIRTVFEGLELPSAQQLSNAAQTDGYVLMRILDYHQQQMSERIKEEEEAIQKELFGVVQRGFARGVRRLLYRPMERSRFASQVRRSIPRYKKEVQEEFLVQSGMVTLRSLVMRHELTFNPN